MTQTRQSGSVGNIQPLPISDGLIGRGLNRIIGGVAGSLNSIDISSGVYPIGTVAKFLHSTSGAIVSFLLVNGTLGSDDVPFSIRSTDYDVLLTKVHWKFIEAKKDGLALTYNQTTTLFHAEILDGASGSMKKKFDNTGVAINA